MIGKTLGDYLLHEELEKGGMGVVYKACHKDNQAITRAVKVIRPEFSADAGFTKRFEAEAASVVELVHPHIVRGFHFGTSEGVHYLVTELIDGENLRKRLRREGRLAVREALHITWQVCSALTYAHQRGLIHRDVKPENIMLRKPGGDAVLADFGLVKMVGEELHRNVTSGIGQESSVQSSRGAGASGRGGGGTPDYMSPEQFESGVVTVRSDIYQVGVVLYECLTGKLPRGRFLNPSKLNPEVPPQLDEIVACCLDANPAGRPDSALSLQRMLKALEEPRLPARPASIVGPALAGGGPARPEKRSWPGRLAILGSLAAVAGGGYLVVSPRFERKGQPAQAPPASPDAARKAVEARKAPRATALSASAVGARVRAPVAAQPGDGTEPDSAPPAGEPPPEEPREGGPRVRMSGLPAGPQVEVPHALPAAEWPGLGLEALELYEAAVKFDEGGASEQDKATNWQQVAKQVPQVADKARARAEEWLRYVRQRTDARKARRQRIQDMDAEWIKLKRLLSLKVMSVADKQKRARMFVAAYGDNSLENPYVEYLRGWLPDGAIRETGFEWVTIPGGRYAMGSEVGESDEMPVHEVEVKTFLLSKSEVTFGHYNACVKAGGCTPAHVSDGSCLLRNPVKAKWAQGALPASSRGDKQPAVCVDQEQARAFSEWVGGCLPSEAEWEYAARNAGKDTRYPWGNGEPGCGRAVMNDGGHGCGRNSPWPVCSRLEGNTRQGLCDMVGNVWEWIQDSWHDSYRGAPGDGGAWESPSSPAQVLRGGSWADDAEGVRVTNRSRGGPDSRDNTRGFRPAKPVPKEAL